jgi:hypothetical protein
MDIYINVCVILGGASLNWSVIVHNVSSDHAGNSFVAAVAPSSSSVHDTGRLSTIFFEDGEISRDIELDVKAAASIGSLDHNDNTLAISIGIILHFIRSLSKIVGRNLDNP